MVADTSDADSSAGPSSPHITAAEELELAAHSFEDISQTPTKPARPSNQAHEHDALVDQRAESGVGGLVSPVFRSIKAGASPPMLASPERKSPRAVKVADLPPDQLSEVSLDSSPVQPSSRGGVDSRSHPMSPSPSMNDEIERFSSSPDAQDTPKQSFFASALSFGQSQPRAQQPPSSRATSSSSVTSTWRNLLSRPTPVEPAAQAAGPSSASLLVNRMSSEAARHDRRRSRQAGWEVQVREGFERVKSEMESAAREMRRDRDNGSDELSSEAIDWSFWGAVVQDYEAVACSRPVELSKAIQQGIPPVIRGSIWQLMSSSKSPSLEEEYKCLLRTESTHEKAIQKDLNRTFPNQAFFQDAAGKDALFNVVKAYSLYDEEVGYTQGLAFIAAALLLNMPDEEAFCVLVRLMGSYNLRSHYLADMPGLQLRLFQFDHLLEEALPLIHTHLVRNGVKSSMYASQWFMTLFSYRCPLPLVYRILDIVLAEGVEAVFRFSLSLLKKAEDRLLQSDFEQILHFLQSDIFEAYHGDGEEWKADEFVRDAYEIRISAFMLDSYELQYEEERRDLNRHANEVDQLRNANRQLSSQVKQLEISLATMDQEHVELVRQLVMNKIEKEEIENELVRYKMLYAEWAHQQEDALSVSSRLSQVSLS